MVKEKVNGDKYFDTVYNYTHVAVAYKRRGTDIDASYFRRERYLDLRRE
jgi:hypothetical protein